MSVLVGTLDGVVADAGPRASDAVCRKQRQELICSKGNAERR